MRNFCLGCSDDTTMGGCRRLVLFTTLWSPIPADDEASFSQSEIPPISSSFAAPDICCTYCPSIVLFHGCFCFPCWLINIIYGTGHRNTFIPSLTPSHTLLLLKIYRGKEIRERNEHHNQLPKLIKLKSIYQEKGIKCKQENGKRLKSF